MAPAREAGFKVVSWNRGRQPDRHRVSGSTRPSLGAAGPEAVVHDPIRTRRGTLRLPDRRGGLRDHSADVPTQAWGSTILYAIGQFRVRTLDSGGRLAPHVRGARALLRPWLGRSACPARRGPPLPEVPTCRCLPLRSGRHQRRPARDLGFAMITPDADPLPRLPRRQSVAIRLSCQRRESRARRQPLARAIDQGASCRSRIA